MLLQTLVQLNLLILATPALTGWALLPPAHPGAVRAACVAWQFRPAQPAAPTSASVRPAAQAPAVSARSGRARPVALPAYSAVPFVPLASCPAFPRAIRAP